MFALRNKSCADRESSDACADVLGEVLSASGSALLKHEVCYVLGQLQSASPGARDALIRCLEDSREHPMVRHEAAEALGSIAHPSTRGYLESFASDPEPIIAESCEVALEIMRREREGEIVTADGAVVAVKRD
jgi:deoxyhypusine monooxygenase